MILNEKICACIGEPSAKICAEALGKYAFAELRGDLCNLTTADLEQLISAHPNLIFTYRISGSSATGNIDAEKAKIQMLAAINAGAAYIDIQEDAPSEILEAIKDACKKSGRCTLIISYHNFAGTPHFEDLLSIAKKCKAAGDEEGKACIVKIATLAKNIADASTVLRLYKNFKTEEGKLIAFSMGAAGKFTRITSLYLGAPFVYCSYSNPTADGQFTCREMKKILDSGNYSFTIPKITDGKLFSQYFKPHTSAGKRPKTINKSVTIPCSKSIAQRAILAAAIAQGESVLKNFEPCNDITSAINFARKAGCIVTAKRDNEGTGEKFLIIKSPGILQWKKFQLVNAGESGLLARLLIPLLSYVSSTRSHTEIASKITLAGEGSLIGRDLSAAVAALKEAGGFCAASREGKYLPFTIGAGTNKHHFTISGKESSQTVSGFLMSLPLLPHDSTLVVENPASVPYITLTINILKQFGIKIKSTPSDRQITFNIRGGQEFMPVHLIMDSDWSSASNFAAAGAIACSVANNATEDLKQMNSAFSIKKMSTKTDQADEAVISVLSLCGAKIKFSKLPEGPAINKENSRYDTRLSFPDNLRNVAITAGKLLPFEFDANNCPDLFPILAVLAMHCSGTSKIKGIGRLLKKESNRAESILEEFTKLGADIYIDKDTMIINGLNIRQIDEKNILLSSHNDHRIAMALILEGMLRQICRDTKQSGNQINNTTAAIKIDDVKCIDKSFPSFLERLQLKRQ